MDESLQNIYHAVRNYASTMLDKRGKEKVLRDINGTAKIISNITYTNTFGNTGIQFKLNAGNEIVALGNIDKKSELALQLATLKEARENEDHSNETVPSSKEIDSVIDSLIQVLNEDVRSYSDRLREKASAMVEIGNAMVEIQNAISENGDYSGNVRGVTFEVKNGQLEIEGQERNLEEVAYFIKDGYPELAEIMNNEVKELKKIREEREDNEIAENVKNLQNDYLDTVKDQISTITEEDKIISEANYQMPTQKTTILKPGVTTRLVENNVEYYLPNTRFIYDRDRNFKSYAGSRYDEKYMIAILERLIERDNAETDPSKKISQADRATIDKLMSALNKSLGHEQPEHEAESDAPEGPETSDSEESQETPESPNASNSEESQETPEVQYRDVRVIMKQEIQSKIDEYRRASNSRNMFPAVTPEDAAKYMQIIEQRKNLANEISMDSMNGIDTSDKEKLLAELELTVDELKDRLRRINDGTLQVTPEEKARLIDLLEAYNYESRMILLARINKRDLASQLRSAQRDGAEDETVESLQEEYDNLPQDLEYSEEQIKRMLSGVTNPETKSRLETLLRSYQYEKEMNERSSENNQKAQDVLPELEDLIHTTPEGTSYVYAEEVENRLNKYKKERDELLAIQNEKQSSDPKKSFEIRMRMAEILGIDIPSLNNIENSDEHSMQYQLDDNEKEEFQNLRDELSKLGNSNKDIQRARQIRIRMAEILGINLPSFDNIENSDEHSMQYQLDDNEKEEFQNLRKQLKDLDGKSVELTQDQKRRLEQLNNIIEELESLTIVMVRERADAPESSESTESQETPEGPESSESTESQETPEGPESSESTESQETPEGPESSESNESEETPESTETETALATKGFYRIVQETSHHEGKQAGSLAITIRNIAKAPLIRPTKIKDGGLGWLGLPLSVMSLPVKVGARIAHHLPNNKTEDKYAEMYNNVRDLYENHPEDFKTLIFGMREDVMRKNKINGLYLRAVQDVLREVVSDEIADTNSKINEHQQFIALDESQMDRMIQEFVNRGILSEENSKFLFSDRAELSPDEITELDRIENIVLRSRAINRTNLDRLQARFQQLRLDRNQHDKASRELEELSEIYDVELYKQFERGAVNKEWGRMNIGITYPILKWFNLNNPDNRDMIEKFADEEDKAIAARREGKEQRALDHEREIEKIRDDNTREVKFGPFIISRGKAIGKQETKKLMEMVRGISETANISQEKAFKLLKGRERLTTDEQRAEFDAIKRQALTSDKISEHDLEKIQAKFKKVEEKVPGVVILPNDQNDTRSRQLMANVAVAAAAYNFFTSYKESHSVAEEQARLDEHIDEHNNHLDDINEHNVLTEKEYQDALSQIQQATETGTANAGTYQAFDTIINGNIQGILAKYHDSYTTLSNQVTGGEWPFADDHAMHEMIEGLNNSYLQIKNSADLLASQGDYQGAIQQLIDFNNSSIQPEMTNVMNYEMGVWQQAIESGSQYSQTYQSMIDVTSEALKNPGDMNDILKGIGNSSMTMPTANSAIEAAKHIGRFSIQIPSTSSIPALATLAATVGNALFGKLMRDREKQQVAPTKRPTQNKEGYFFDDDER